MHLDLTAAHPRRSLFHAAWNAPTDPLWLPQKVMVTSEVSGEVFQEQHLYSNYRAYGVETKITF